MKKSLKVLFVSSGNKNTGISPVVKNQGESLKKHALDLDYFTIKGKGILGYLGNIKKLSKQIRKQNYDVIHAHYSLSGILATMSAPARVRIVVSLMGTIRKGTWKYFIVRFLTRNRWKALIVKSKKMKSQVGLHQAFLIPNGVDLEKIPEKPDRSAIRRELGFAENIKYIIFAADPARPEKNINLCRNAVELLDDPSVKLVTVYNKPHKVVIDNMLAGDVVMLTSFTEGSPNVIKEAMAANCPIVTTDVGDVKEVIGNTEGCYILNSYEETEAAEKLKSALAFNNRTNGRGKIISLGLDDMTIAKRLIEIYTS